MDSTANLSTDELIRLTFASVKNIEASLGQLQNKVTMLENNVTSLNKQVYDLQNIVNLREQEQRGLSVRVAGIPYTDEEKASTDAKFLAKKVYDKVLLPVLNFAKSKNQIDRVPSLATTVQHCYRAGRAAAPTGTGAPPPIVLKFSNEHTRLIILKNKRLGLPAPPREELDMGIVRYSISEDLTAPCYKLVKELHRHEEVAKVWTVDGKIRIIKRGSQSVFRVKSVFDSVDSILSKASA
jgi:hypothetical protein